MKTLIAAAFIVVSAGLAQAMPAAPIPADGLTTLVAQGCGPGFYRGPGGRCRMKPILRPCPPGMRRNAIGRCVPWRR